MTITVVVAKCCFVHTFKNVMLSPSQGLCTCDVFYLEYPLTPFQLVNSHYVLSTQIKCHFLRDTFLGSPPTTGQVFHFCILIALYSTL